MQYSSLFWDIYFGDISANLTLKRDELIGWKYIRKNKRILEALKEEQTNHWHRSHLWELSYFAFFLLHSLSSSSSLRKVSQRLHIIISVAAAPSEIKCCFLSTSRKSVGFKLQRVCPEALKTQACQSVHVESTLTGCQIKNGDHLNGKQSKCLAFEEWRNAKIDAAMVHREATRGKEASAYHFIRYG